MSSFLTRLFSSGMSAVRKQFRLPNFRDAELLMWNHLWTLMKGSKITSPYAQHAAVYRATREIARRLASVPWIIETGKIDEPVVINDDRVRNLLDNPNPETTSSDLWESLSSYLDLRGECLLICEGRENVSQLPRELWVEPCDNWDRYIDPESKVIIKWVEKVPAQGAKERRTLPFWQAIHLKQFNPDSAYVGQSTISAAMSAIETDGLAASLNQAYLQNGAEPGGLLSTDQPLDQPQADAILERWKDRYGGDPSKRGRPAILHSGLKYQSISLSHKDMQYLEQRRWTREEVAMVFGVPFEIMGFGQKTYDNLDTAERVLYQGVVVPRGNDIGEILTEKLFGPATGGKLRFRFDWAQVLALQEQIAEKVNTTVRLWGMGVPLQEAARITGIKLKLDNVPGADVAWIPGGLIPAESQEKAQPSSAAGPFGQLAQAAQKAADATLAQELDMFVNKVAENAALVALPVSQPIESREERIRIANEIVEKAMRPGEKTLVGKVRKFFLDQRGAQLKRLHEVSSKKETSVRKALSPDDVEDLLLDYDEWDDELGDRLSVTLEQVIQDSARQASGQAGATWDPKDPLAQKVLEERLFRLKEINETTKQAVKDALAEGIGEGESVSDLADRVRGVYNQASRNRATMIARTEAANAANGARNAIFDALGISKTQWISAHDDRVRDTHRELDGKTLPMGEDFGQFIGVTGLTHPGDPDAPASESINCRCVVVPLIELDEDEEE